MGIVSDVKNLFGIGIMERPTRKVDKTTFDFPPPRPHPEAKSTIVQQSPERMASWRRESEEVALGQNLRDAIAIQRAPIETRLGAIKAMGTPETSRRPISGERRAIISTHRESSVPPFIQGPEAATHALKPVAQEGQAVTPSAPEGLQTSAHAESLVAAAPLREDLTSPRRLAESLARFKGNVGPNPAAKPQTSSEVPSGENLG